MIKMVYMKKQKKVSIIITTYNDARTIDACLDSLKKLSYKNKEVIFVDGGSNDGTQEKIINAKFVLLKDEHKGVAAARNIGIKASTGDIIIFSDGDCVFPKDWIEKLIRPLEDPLVGASGGPDLAPKKVSIHTKCVNYLMTSFLTSGGLRGGDITLCKLSPSGCNLAIKKSILQEVDMFDENFAGRGEEKELETRIRRQGFKIKFAKDAFVYHYRRTNTSAFLKQTYLSGVARKKILLTDIRNFEIVHIFPSVFLTVMFISSILSLFVPFFRFFLLLQVGLYLAYLTIITIAGLIKIKSFKSLFYLPVLCIIFHFSYGFGLIFGKVKTDNIVIVNDGPGYNLGDTAILNSMFFKIKGELPNYNLLSIHNSTLSVKEYFRLIFHTSYCKLFIFGGGQEIKDDTSFAFLISGLIKVFIALIFFKKVILFSIGVGPIKRNISKMLCKIMLNKVNIIIVRDEYSKKILKEIGIIRPKIIVTSDFSILLNKSDQDEVLKRYNIPHYKKIIGISPRKWYKKGNILPQIFQKSIFDITEYENRIAKLAYLCDYLAELGYTIFFIPTTKTPTQISSQDDERVCQDILRRMKNKQCAFSFKDIKSPSDLKAILSLCTLVMGDRMHSLILASSCGVPVISLTRGTKNAYYMKSIGLNANMVDSSNFEVLELIDLVKFNLKNRTKIKREIEEKITRLENMLNINILEINKLLNED